MNKNIKYSQNFLTSEKVLNQIIKQLNLKETDTVYEIGTGKGHLTTKLAKISKQVTSIELDSHLFNLSSEKLKLNTRVTLIHQDILQFQFPNKQRYKIVGSIPYHLSTQIIKKVVFESHASDIYLIVEEGFYKRTLDIHRTLGLLLHTQVSIQQLLIERSKLDRETNIELVETMWNQFSNLGIYELNVIDTTTHSIKDTVSAVKEKIVSGTALLF